MTTLSGQIHRGITPGLFAIVMFGLCDTSSAIDDGEKNVAVESTAEKQAVDKDGWMPLFNGKNLDGWKVTNFGGEGEVEIRKEAIVITQGVDLSGITSTRKDLPKINYEIEFEAQRFAGSDFFVGLTFPVRESHCSLICGGWGGGVTGISSIDGMDAVENETTGYLNFTNGQWYKVRIKVTSLKIEAWLDTGKIVDIDLTDQKIDVRFEMDLCKPLGFSTYQSTAFIRNARVRKLPQPDKVPKTSDKKTVK